MEPGVTKPAGREAVDVWRRYLRAVTTKIAETDVVEQDDNNVGGSVGPCRPFGPPRGRLCSRRSNVAAEVGHGPMITRLCAKARTEIDLSRKSREGVQYITGCSVEPGMERYSRLDAGSVEITKLEMSLHLGDVVVVDADAALLRRPATRDVLHVLLHSGLIGPIRHFRARYRARRTAKCGLCPSVRYLAGVHHDDFARLMHELAADLKFGANAAMLDLIDMHVRSGDFVVVVTDAPQTVATWLAAEIGVQRGVGVDVDVDGGVLTGEIVPSGASGNQYDRLVATLGDEAVTNAKFYGRARCPGYGTR